jgi:undecaprenyl diphosphate synthase
MGNLKHVAIIPDGNRRWARKHKLPILKGHEQGAKVLEDILQVAFDNDITCFSFWGGSLTNLTQRTRQEVYSLQKLYALHFKRLLKNKAIHENRVKVTIIGEWEEVVGEEAKNSINEVMKATREYDSLFFNLFIAYDGIVEMLHAIKRITFKVRENPELIITPELVKENLYTSEFPPVDFLIRTGGEPHLSAGFMMWDIAESQLYISEKYWPEFTGKDFIEAVNDFEKRERRFGR